MRRHVIRALDELPVLHSHCVATIGVFDGLHLGHASILARLAGAARERSLPSVCVTFSVHPREVLRQAMEHEGFTVYDAEWWHFDYKDWKHYAIGNLSWWN